MREFTFSITYEPGADPLMDEFVEHPELAADSMDVPLAPDAFCLVSFEELAAELGVPGRPSPTGSGGPRHDSSGHTPRRRSRSSERRVGRLGPVP